MGLVDKFIEGNKECLNLKGVIPNAVNMVTVEPAKATPAKSNRKTTKKKENGVNNPPLPTTSMSYIQENIPYASAYAETTTQIDDTISQLNYLNNENMADMAAVRASKTLRNKYTIINDMTSTSASILSTKLAAIKEKNNIINNINKLELDRLRQIKSKGTEEDDNVRIANLYDAFINTPIGAGHGVLGPNVQDVITAGGANALPVMSIGGGNDMMSTQAWQASLSPAENRMVLEAQGAIDTVVVYDANTGNRWFEVVDRNTNQPVPNVEKPDSTNIYDLDINVRGGYAKDTNRNTTYRLICVNGTDTSIMDY